MSPFKAMAFRVDSNATKPVRSHEPLLLTISQVSTDGALWLLSNRLIKLELLTQSIMRQTAAVWHWTLPEGSVLAVAFKDADRCFALKLIYYNIYYFCCQWSGRLHLGIYGIFEMIQRNVSLFESYS